MPNEIVLNINGREHRVEATPDTPLLWVLRDHLNLTGTKYGCGMAMCGACTVHMDGRPVRSCITPAAAATGKSITTIEALSESPEGRALQAAWTDLNVVQCGYCQSGQLMSAAALLSDQPDPSDEEINTAMAGNLCRCATYHRIRAAIHAAAEKLNGNGGAA